MRIHIFLTYIYKKIGGQPASHPTRWCLAVLQSGAPVYDGEVGAKITPSSLLVYDSHMVQSRGTPILGNPHIPIATLVPTSTYGWAAPHCSCMSNTCVATLGRIAEHIQKQQNLAMQPAEIANIAWAFAKNHLSNQAPWRFHKAPRLGDPGCLGNDQQSLGLTKHLITVKSWGFTPA